jgi:hypothetical protein
MFLYLLAAAVFLETISSNDFLSVASARVLVWEIIHAQMMKNSFVFLRVKSKVHDNRVVKFFINIFS